MSVELLKQYFQKMDLRNSVPCGGDVKIPAVVGFIFPEQLKELLEKGEKPLIVDVREECEAQKMPFKAEGVEVKVIPIREILDRLGEIPKDKPVILVCNFAIRASMAKLALDLLGYNNIHIYSQGHYCAQCYMSVDIRKHLCYLYKCLCDLAEPNSY